MLSRRHLLASAAAFAAGAMLPRIVRPAPAPSDTGFIDLKSAMGPTARHVFVSQKGSDANGGSESAPVATIRRATQLATSAKGQAVLWLAAGGVWSEVLLIKGFGGPSSSEPFIVRSWGGLEAGRATITGRDAYLCYVGAAEHVLLKGLRFIAAGRDPAQPGFSKSGGASYSIGVRDVADLAIEDCELAFARTGCSVHNADGFIYRRNVTRNNWNADSSGLEHSQGIYLETSRGIVLEGNAFLEGGWLADSRGKVIAPATAYNHSAYIHASNADGTVIRGNLFYRAANNALQARAGGIVTDNVAAYCARAFSYGLVHGLGPAHANGITGELARNVSVGCPNSGVECDNVRAGSGVAIRDNAFLNVNAPAVALLAGRPKPTNGKMPAPLSVGVSDLTIERNAAVKCSRGFQNVDLSSGKGRGKVNGLKVAVDNRWAAKLEDPSSLPGQRLADAHRARGRGEWNVADDPAEVAKRVRAAVK